MKHLFIVNPVAGGKDRREYVAEQARRALEGSEDAYELYVTTAPMDACAKIAAEAASGEELRVYACGGDGTLNEWPLVFPRWQLSFSSSSGRHLGGWKNEFDSVLIRGSHSDSGIAHCGKWPDAPAACI